MSRGGGRPRRAGAWGGRHAGKDRQAFAARMRAQQARPGGGPFEGVRQAFLSGAIVGNALAADRARLAAMLKRYHSRGLYPWAEILAAMGDDERAEAVRLAERIRDTGGPDLWGETR